MYRVKIYGAGSIGNHMAHASRALGWDVVVCDVSDAALARMREEIYPARYGAWDPAIIQVANDRAPRDGFDLIVVGTPPPVHLPLALDALTEHPRAILVEKPLCPPTLEGAEGLHRAAHQSRTRVFVGYDHVVGKAVTRAEALIRSGVIGEVRTLDVEFREHWEGIFTAHPWLSGPADSYLGYSTQGGGASGEHSHALNLWQHFAHVVGAGRVVEVSAMLNYVCRRGAVYDDLCLLSLRTEKGLVGRVVQDVVSRPPVKRARAQGTDAALEWVNGYSPEGDAVRWERPGRDDVVDVIPKRRPDDFIEELRHVHGQLEGAEEPSGIALERGLDTMLVLAAAHRSERDGVRVRIDWSRGYTEEAFDAK